MKKLFTFILSALVCTLVMAERPTGVIQKAGDVLPVIDGQIDDVWADVTQFNVDKPFKTEVPTLGDEGTTYWKMVWDDAGLYILVVANDDFWFPYTGTGNEYEYDKIELYFDTNYILTDGVGGQAGTTGNRQISFAINGNTFPLDGTVQTATVQGGDVKYAYKVDDPKWTSEWFIPWESIPDKDGVLFDKTAQMGFDVDITDRDPDDAARKRAMWANVGAIDENWNNMDDAGYITLDGAEAGIYVDGIVLTASGDITTDNGTSQLSVVVEPADATQQKMKWVVTGGTGKVSISSTGLVKGVKDGTVTVKAAATDGGWAESNEITLNVSGQKVEPFEVSYILNGDFNEFDAATLAPGAPWSGGSKVVDGVLQITNTNVIGDAPNPWDWTVGQSLNIPAELKDIPYVLHLKLWADADRVFDVDIESGDPYTRFGDSPDPKADNGTSQWRFNLTTTPTNYDLEITSFTRMDPANTQKFNLFAGQANPTVYVDSVYLVSKDDLALKAPKGLALNSMKVYPSPVGNANQLNVSLTSAGGKITIYNALGQKMIEKVATANLVKFDVTNLRKGMYFVKLSDGTTQKFIR